MEQEESITVLIIDDHPIVREGLTALINRQPDMCVIGEASSGPQGVALYESLRPAVALVDLRLPGLSGLDVIRNIAREHPGSALIALTAYEGEEDIYQALQSGARGYLMKDAFREQLLEAIRCVSAGQRYLPQVVASCLAERLQRPELTGREKDVLKLIVQGLSNKQIAFDLGLSEGTVKGHVYNVLAKLGVEDRTHATVAALKRGLVHL